VNEIPRRGRCGGGKEAKVKNKKKNQVTTNCSKIPLSLLLGMLTFSRGGVNWERIVKKKGGPSPTEKRER